MDSTGTPDIIQNQRSGCHLLLLNNRFGRCLGGTHAASKQTDTDRVHQLSEIKVKDFITIESLGVECNPLFRGCRYGPLSAKNYCLKEEKEF